MTAKIIAIALAVVVPIILFELWWNGYDINNFINWMTKMHFKAKKGDPFEGQMVEVPAGQFVQDNTFHYAVWKREKRKDPKPWEDEEFSYRIDHVKRQFRRVIISKPFLICKYPVTQGQWYAIMGNNPSDCRSDKGHYYFPVESVSWDDCRQFLKRLNEKTGKHYSLPTEAQWEWAARGAQPNDDNNPLIGHCKDEIVQEAYSKPHGPWAGCTREEDVEDYAWYFYNRKNYTPRVGQKKPNELGLYDMSGNVWEWCRDAYKEDLGYKEAVDPVEEGAIFGKHVCRGGCHESFLEDCGVTARSDGDEDAKLIGLRLVLPID